MLYFYLIALASLYIRKVLEQCPRGNVEHWTYRLFQTVYFIHCDTKVDNGGCYE